MIFLTNSLFVHKLLHIYQLKDYNNIRYLKYFSLKQYIFIFFCFILLFFEIFIKNILFYIGVNIIFYILNLFYLKNLIKSKKTPLKFTRKMSRLYIFSIFILAITCLHKHSFLLIIILTFLSPILANFINIYDKIKNHHFIKLAQKKLKNSKVQIIAITGSNGKTSVKNILSKMLATQFKVQHTPASFNTPLGIAKFINTELKFDTDFVILEYGARHKNDIKKLCSLYGADYGIITTISPQHLESFHSVENVFKAKQELANHLQNKPCVFNTDNIYCLRMFNEKSGTKLSCSIHTQANTHATNIKVENKKMCFDLNLNNKIYNCETALLGKHNITNICLSSALASYLGISANNIISTIKTLEPVEHRLELITTHINILDDTYNCSLTSAKEALWVLKNFPGKKMVATPGIIDCGKEKYNINFELGKQIAFCDYCIIIGEENKIAIVNGIKKAVSENPKPLKQPKTYCENSLEIAKQHFSKLNSGDTLLLLNDLPDDYS